MIKYFFRYDSEGKILSSGTMDHQFIDAEIANGELIAYSNIGMVPRDGTYAYINGSLVEQNIPVIIPTLSELKIKKIADLATLRFYKEVGGITINSILFYTDRESQNKYLAQVIMIDKGLVSSVSWKVNDGIFMTFSASDFYNICMAIMNHVKSCFDNEKTLIAAINACQNETELNNLNLNQGWDVGT